MKHAVTLTIVGALAATRMLAVLYGVSAADPVSFLHGRGVVLAAIVIVTLVPAWGAARINPLTALRHE
jgi:ABC-type antimicrobial peptide transport system permease subunit